MRQADRPRGRGSSWESGDGPGAGRSSRERRSLTTDDKKYAEAQQASADDQAAAPTPPAEPAQYAPPPADPADEIEHLAQLHASGALTDEEFAAAKAKVLGT